MNTKKKQTRRVWVERFNSTMVEIHWREPMDYDLNFEYWKYADDTNLGYSVRFRNQVYTGLTGLEPPRGNHLDELCGGKYVRTWRPA